MTSTGIFLCTCDQKIGKGIDVERVARALDGEGKVIFTDHVCLPDGIRQIQHDIFENNLDRVVVAACPRRYQEKSLQDACAGAGINHNRFTLVDWREGCAQAHRGDREGSTNQAIDLVRMGIARVARAHPLDGVLTKIAPRALVIGGGIAGLTAALSLSGRGIPVTLVERKSTLGGEAVKFPLNGHGEAFEATRSGVLNDRRIDVRTGSRVVAVTGTVGNYHVEIASHSGADRSHIDAGAVVIATGAREYRDPRLYRYDGRRVVTLGEFEEYLQRSPSDTPHSLVFLLCAGSRDEHIPYCSNICCLGALNQAIRFKRAHPTENVTILFRDLYLLGDELNAEVVREARREGVEFVHYAASAPPQLEDDFLVVKDTGGITRWIGYDRLVLATAQVPREDAGLIASMFNLTRDENGFFPDPHWRLRPEQQSEGGVFVCGSAHHPVDIDTAVMQGLTAAARAARFIQKRELMRPASAAHVDARLCTGCAHCIETCPVDAISLVPAPPAHEHPLQTGGGDGDRGVRASVDSFLCLACGNCAAACPTKAIEMPAASDAMIFAQIEAAMPVHGDAGTARQVEPLPVLIFACQWSGFAAMELAGARRLKYPANVRVIELPCSARLDPMHVLYGFLCGAEKIVLALCPPDDCHFGSGNRYAEARVERMRAELASRGIDPRRLQVARMMGDDPGAWVKAVELAATFRARAGTSA